MAVAPRRRRGRRPYRPAAGRRAPGSHGQRPPAHCHHRRGRHPADRRSRSAHCRPRQGRRPAAGDPVDRRADSAARRRVLVVDDSTFMRMVLRRIIEAGSELTVVGEARNGREAVALARDLKPDIITMDVEMPELDGLAAMKQILAGPPPKPIMIMVSGHTQRGTETTIKALSLGAVDFVSKSSSFAAEDLGHVDSELSEKLRYW